MQGENTNVSAFSKDRINQSNEYEAISDTQNISPKGLLGQPSFTSDSYKISGKRLHFCVSCKYIGLPFLVKVTETKNVMLSAP